MTDAPSLSGSPSSGFLEATYILPIRKTNAEGDGQLGRYLEALSGRMEVIVVDGSPEEVSRAHRLLWPSCRQLSPDPAFECANGKVWGVLTGLREASYEKVVIADEDVRYDRTSLERLLAHLDRAEVVRPQNYFEPSPWHTQWDTARTLLNRATGGDWPGTLGVRRSLLQAAGGYDGDCLFENLELVRTVLAAGGREEVPLDLYVARRPPPAAHFLSQRVRQAYDEFARPWRLVLQLSFLPLSVLLSRRPGLLLAFVGLTWAAAEAGRRRSGGERYFPFGATLMAPLWLAERGICSWLAVFCRLRYGGVRYHGRILRRAATPSSVLSRRLGRRS
jgi:hypothetical protein